MTPDNFNELLLQHRDHAYRMAFGLTGGNDAEAHDLVQDTFLKAWKLDPDYEFRSPDAWLYCAMRNLHVDRARRKARLGMLSLDDRGPSENYSWEETLAARTASPLDECEAHEVRRTVRAALKRLSPDYRDSVILCDLEGWSYQDIAQRLACPVGTVRSRIHRGRCELRRSLARAMRRSLPALVAVATAIGTWYLCRIQQLASRAAQPPIMAKPVPRPAAVIEIGFHRDAPTKGETHDQPKS